jgi:hypothetical protein
MSYHVDVLENDWAKGVQRLAARAFPNGSHLEVTDTPDPDFWRTRLERTLYDTNIGNAVTVGSDPKYYLRLLAEEYADSTYVQVVGPHENGDCPFDRTTVLPMKELSVPPQPVD